MSPPLSSSLRRKVHGDEVVAAAGLEHGPVMNEILEVKGVDAFAAGPNDHAQSMGLPGQPQRPEVFAAQARVADRIRVADGQLRVDLIDRTYLRI